MRYRFHDLEIDEDAYTIRRAGRVIDLEPRVFEVLVHLIRNRERMVSKVELLQQVWRGCVVSDSVIARCVCIARRQLQVSAAIRTVHGRGYQWVAMIEDGPRTNETITNR
jgi:DNA-binding winged helix-turn-helix (wHTH) protein